MALRRFLHNNNNSAAEGRPKSSVIELLQEFFSEFHASTRPNISHRGRPFPQMGVGNPFSKFYILI